MQVSLITALALLVLTVIAFVAGRQGAARAAEATGRRLHSLPNYFGYHVALWTGAPAALILAIYGVFGAAVVDGFAVSRIEQAASAYIARYEERLATDEAAEAAREELVHINVELTAAESEILRASGGGEAAAGERTDELERWRARRAELLAARSAAQSELRSTTDAIAAEIYARAEADGASQQAMAGLEYYLLPEERRQLFIADARALAFDQGLASVTTPGREGLASAMRPYESLLRYSVAGLALALAIGGLTFARLQITPEMRARNRVEAAMGGVLFLASAMAVLTTVGIVLSLLFESIRFFGSIDWRVTEFLFGLQWSPQIAIRADQIGQSGAFGAVPLFAGTALITVIAMLVAAPIGLFAAIYLSEYAGPGVRAWAKPALEILAGVPTVVYGFFALLVVGPFLRDLALALGYEDAVTQSALSAGLVMGVMIIPFVSSLSDDVINAVPQSLRDGSYAMGATTSETVRQVVLPAALPGIVGALLLAVSRAIGETMIVVMAAGQGANLTANPLESVTTITVQIVMLLTGDQEFDSPKTLSAFALGLVLFILTLALNVIALRVVQRYREKYE
jgi:phosphate transport system permease protein